MTAITRSLKRVALFATLLVAISQPTLAQPNTLTAAEQKAGWRLLFDGQSFAGWRGLGYDSVPSSHWRISHGTIMKVGSANIPRQPDGTATPGGDLMTVATYENFELVWEWKMTARGNSGVKYNVSEEFAAQNKSPHSALGWEYQIQDDSLGDDIALSTHRTGSLYDMIAAHAEKFVRPVGEWNESRLVFNGSKGEHWLNGHKVLHFDMASPEFAALFAKSKYKNIPQFMERRTGHVVLQDHNDEVYFRSIRLRVIH